MALLEVRDVARSFVPGTAAVDGVSLELARGRRIFVPPGRAAKLMPR